jgi:hypothetical protein
VNWNQQHIKKFMYRDQVSFIPGMWGWFNICKSLNVIQNINRSKGKNHMIISIDAEKPFTNSTFFHDKTKNRRKLSLYIYIYIYIYHSVIYIGYIWQTYSHIILNREKLKHFLLKSGTRQRFYSLHSYSTVLELLARAIRQEEVIRIIQIQSKEVKLFLFADDMILYLRDTENSTKRK